MWRHVQRAVHTCEDKALVTLPCQLVDVLDWDVPGSVKEAGMSCWQVLQDVKSSRVKLRIPKPCFCYNLQAQHE